MLHEIGRKLERRCGAEVCEKRINEVKQGKRMQRKSDSLMPKSHKCQIGLELSLR